jgi:hypothetical protein
MNLYSAAIDMYRGAVVLFHVRAEIINKLAVLSLARVVLNDAEVIKNRTGHGGFWKFKSKSDSINSKYNMLTAIVAFLN